MGTRVTGGGVEKVYEAADKWVQHALRTDDSLFTPGTPIWSRRWLSELHDRFMNHPDESSDSFLQKLQRQLVGSPPQIYQLMGEALYFYFLIVATKNSSNEERVIDTVLSWSPSPMAVPQDLVRGLTPGIVNPGQYFHTSRPFQVAFLIEFVEQWKDETPELRRRLLADPWAFKDFAVQRVFRSKLLQGHAGKTRAQRAALLHLVFPDTFEAIVSDEHKKRIARAFADLVVTPEGDVDRRLEQIRSGLEPKYGSSDHLFFSREIRRRWDYQSRGYDDARRLWWVNQGSTHQQEVDRGYLWAPVESKSGVELPHHRSMADLQVGDTVFHYWSGRIQAVSTVAVEAANSPIPAELASQGWQREGRLAQVDVGVLDDPVSLEDIPLEWRQEEGGPFNRTGSVNQGYLYPVSQDFIAGLCDRFPQLKNRVSIDPGVLREAAPDYVEPDFATIRSHIEAEGLVVSDRTLQRFHLSLRSRGFVILSGISGTGKTWLAQAYARAIGGRELLVPVAPNWTTNEDLLGYLNPLSGVYHDTAFSKFLREASLEWKSAAAKEREPVPYFLVLDEMNLARVEYYFATFLSALEVRQREDTAHVQLGEDTVLLTPNLRFVGTVNVDETTHGFADKVYDRAQLVELEAPREAIERHLADLPLAQTLLAAWEALHEIAPFAFRVIDDIRNYVEAADTLGVEVETALDEQMLQKLLPKVHGIDPRIEQALTRFIELCGDRYPLSADKARRMRIRFNEHGSASYFA